MFPDETACPATAAQSPNCPTQHRRVELTAPLQMLACVIWPVNSFCCSLLRYAASLQPNEEAEVLKCNIPAPSSPGTQGQVLLLSPIILSSGFPTSDPFRWSLSSRFCPHATVHPPGYTVTCELWLTSQAGTSKPTHPLNRREEHKTESCPSS